MRLLVLLLCLLLPACAGLNTRQKDPERNVTNTCAFALLLPVPASVAALAACGFGADKYFGDREDAAAAEAPKAAPKRPTVKKPAAAPVEPEEEDEDEPPVDENFDRDMCPNMEATCVQV